MKMTSNEDNLEIKIKKQSPYLPIHLADVASSYTNSCGLDCTDRRVCSLGLLVLGP